jgi:hypothetical protein
MSTLTFSLPEDKAEQLALSAQELGVAVEELLRKITDDYLTRKKEFLLASEYVLQKNAELYRRLA